MGHKLLEDDEILESEEKFFPSHLERVKVKIPEDCVTRYQIDKFAKFVAKEGFHFEDEILYEIEKERLSNPVILSCLKEGSDKDI